MVNVAVSLSTLERIGFCDLAGSHQVVKRVRSRQAIIIIGIDHLMRIFVLLAWAGRLPTSKLKEKLIEVGGLYKPRRFGIEANAMQFLFADLVAEQAKELKKRIPFVPVNQPTKIEKTWRLRTTLQPVIADGRLFVMDGQVELISELTVFPMGATMDLVDCLASAIRLAPQRAPQQADKSESDALARYLRETGANPQYILQRVKEIEEEAARKTALDNTDSIAL